MNGRWEQPSRWGIQLSGITGDHQAAYNAGRVEDIVRLDPLDPTAPHETPVVLAACHRSGVWQINQAGGATRSLSFTWAQPGTRCLALGIYPGARHVYAGGDALQETDTTQADPLANWRPIPIIDRASTRLDIGKVLDMVVLPVKKLLVLACERGLVFAPIPAPGGVYRFSFADMPRSARYSAVAEGIDETVVAGIWGDGSSPNFGILWGKFQVLGLGINRRLHLTSHSSLQSPITDGAGTTFDPAKMRRISLDSCKANRAVVYAVASYEQPLAPLPATPSLTIYCVLTSTTGGQATTAVPPGPGWTVAGFTVNGSSEPLFGKVTDKPFPGDQGDYNNCLAAAPLDPLSVAIGWQEGYFYSTDGAKTWTARKHDAAGKLHMDLHGVTYDPMDATQKTLYLGSDGGVDITMNLGVTSSARANRRFPNLLATKVALSTKTTGLCVLALQDNGGPACNLYPRDTQPFRISGTNFGGDGRIVAFLPNNRFLYASTNVFDNTWNPIRKQFEPRNYAPLTMFGIIPVDVPNPQSFPQKAGIVLRDDGGMFVTNTSGTDPDQKLAEPLEPLLSPAYKNTAGESMVAIAAVDTEVYGLFLLMDANAATNPAHWSYLVSIPKTAPGVPPGTAPQKIFSLGSVSGNIIYAGTDKGRIYQLTAQPTIPWPVTGNPVREVSPFPLAGSIIRIVLAAEELGYAITNSTTLFRMQLNVDHFPVWTPTPNPADLATLGGTYIALCLNPLASPHTVFAASDAGVFSSPDMANTWTTISGPSLGLPTGPHCMDLVFNAEPLGAQYLYLAAYGWGVWRTVISAPVPNDPVDVIVNGEMGLQLEEASDENTNPFIPPEKYTLDALNPYAELVVTNQLKHMTTTLVLMFELRPGAVVNVAYNVHLAYDNSSDEDTAMGEFQVPIGTMKATNAFVTFSGTGDSANVNFTITT